MSRARLPKQQIRDMIGGRTACCHKPFRTEACIASGIQATTILPDNRLSRTALCRIPLNGHGMSPTATVNSIPELAGTCHPDSRQHALNRDVSRAMQKVDWLSPHRGGQDEMNLEDVIKRPTYDGRDVGS